MPALITTAFAVESVQDTLQLFASITPRLKATKAQGAFVARLTSTFIDLGLQHRPNGWLAARKTIAND